MTIINARKGDRGTLRDADGNEIVDCVAADTETGWCTIKLRDDQGRVCTYGREVLTESVKHKAPLQWTEDMHATEAAKAFKR